MKRTAFNPWDWSKNFGFNQGEVIESVTRQMQCAGQTSVDADGTPQHLDDMRGQMSLAIDNLTTVLAAGDFRLSDVINLQIYSTQIDDTLRHYDLVAKALGAAGAAPPVSLIGVTRLANAGLMVEIVASAAQ